MDHASLAAMHRATAARMGPRTALRFPRQGAYHDLSWEAYRRQADAAAAALIGLAVQPGDRVGLLSENRPEWLVADIAILSAGAVDVPLHAPLSARQVAYQLGHSGARGVVVSDQAQVDKVLAAAASLPALEWLVAFDPVTVAGPVRHLSWDRFVREGRGADAERAVLGREGAIARGDLATLIYTSGTTGQPKGVMLSHGNLLANAEATLENSGVGPDDLLLSWLPYSHIYARTCDVYLTALAGATVCLAGSIETLTADLAEVQPTWLTAVPRFYEKVWAAVEPLPPEARADRLRRIFGPRIRQLTSGGAPLPRHVCQGFLDAGLLLMEGYGLTESSPVITFNHPKANRVGTVGRPIAGVEVRIADDGEILTRGPHVMMGYWQDPAATREAIVDGWLHTGDIGHLDDDGFLTITDRKKDLIITAGGKNIAPAELERLLTGDPYIDQAVVCGDGRPFVTALVVPDLPRLEAKAAELGCGLQVEGGLIRSGPLVAFLRERIDRIMQAVSQPERVRAFLLLARPFQLDAEELTATLKVRRRFLIEKHADALNRLYENRPGAVEIDG